MNAQLLCKLGVCSMTVLIQTIMTLIFLCSFSRHKGSQPNVTPVRIALLVSLSSILWGVSCILVTLDEIDGVDSLATSIWNNSMGIILVVSTIAFYLYRLHNSFKDSMYQINKKTLIFFSIITILASLLIFLPDCIFPKYGQDSNYGSESDKPYMFIMVSIATALVAFEYIGITTIFAYKLFQLTLRQRASISPHNMSVNNQNQGNHLQAISPVQISESPSHSPVPNNGRHVHVNSININNSSLQDGNYRNTNIDSNSNNSHHGPTRTDANALRDSQLKLIEVITKQSLLIMTPFISLMVCLTVTMLMIFTQDSTVDAARYVVSSWAVVEICCSMWLSFTFATKQYAFCCNSRHNKLKKCCIKVAIWRLNAVQR